MPDGPAASLPRPSSGAGKDFEKGKLTLQDLVALAAKNGEPKQTSGKQERFENLLNQYLVRC